MGLTGWLGLRRREDVLRRSASRVGSRRSTGRRSGRSRRSTRSRRASQRGKKVEITKCIIIENYSLTKKHIMHFQKMTISSYIECQAAKGQMEYLVFCKRHTSTISTTKIEPRLLISKITAGKVGRCHISRRHRLIWVYLPTGAVRSHSARAEFNFTVRPPDGASGARQQARSMPPGGGARN